MLVLKKNTETNARGIPHQILLDKPTTSLGRNSAVADVYIDSRRRPYMISRVHAQLKRNDESGVYTLISLGMNGVLVNGIKTERVALKEGDEVVFGGSGVETRIGERVQYPDSDLVFTFMATPVADNDETRGLDTLLDQSTNSGILTMTGVSSQGDNELLDLSQVSQSVIATKEDDRSSVACDAKTVESTASKQPEEACSSKSKLLDGLNEEFVCCICRELICVAHSLPCSHAFCKDCIKQWLKKSKECPNCRCKASFEKAIPVKMIDNAVDHVAANTLSEDELKERNARIERLLHEDGPKPKKQKVVVIPTPTRMTTRRTRTSGDIIVISSDSESNQEERDVDESFEQPDRDDEDYSAHYGVEHSRSNRARCRVCWLPIPLNDLRWFRSGRIAGTLYDYTHYYHFGCYHPPSHITFDQVSVFGLSRDEKNYVREKFY